MCCVGKEINLASITYTSELLTIIYSYLILQKHVVRRISNSSSSSARGVTSGLEGCLILLASLLRRGPELAEEMLICGGLAGSGKVT
jgi:hypothetical protein